MTLRPSKRKGSCGDRRDQYGHAIVVALIRAANLGREADTNRSLRWVERGVKNNHAMSCDAENRGHLRILRRCSKETELRSIASP